MTTSRPAARVVNFSWWVGRGATSSRAAARAGPLVLLAVLVAGLVGPLLAPRPPGLQEDAAGARHLPPLTRAHLLQIDRHRAWIVTSLQASGEGFTFVRAGQPGAVAARELLEPPAPRFYLLGTDGLGRDLLSRLLAGTRHSVGVAFLCVALAVSLAVAVGSVAGLAGGWVDGLLMRGVDVLMSIPRLLIYVLCAALFHPSALLLVLVLGATTWTGLSRIVRGQALALREGDLIVAARAAGCSTARILLRHLLPQVGPILAVGAALRFADTVVLESALSFLGIGAPPPAVSLGGIMASGRDALADAWWISAWPGLLIAAVVLGLRSTAARLLRLSDPPSIS